MKLAYLIMAHKNPDQVAELLRATHRKGDYYIVHCDRKARDLPDRIKDHLDGTVNRDIVRFSERRISVVWGGFSIAQVMLEGIAQLLRMAGDWDYFINLSGQCYLTKPVDAIVEFLAAQRGCNFIEVFDQEKEWPASLYRIRTYHLEIASLFFNTRVRRSYPKYIRPYGGSNWLMLNRRFCEYLVNSPSSQRIIDFYRYAANPDELIVQTVIMNSPFKDTVVRDNKRLILWDKERTSHPRVLTLADWQTLVSGGHLFARKFDPAVDEAVIKRLRQLLDSVNDRGQDEIGRCHA